MKLGQEVRIDDMIFTVHKVTKRKDIILRWARTLGPEPQFFILAKEVQSATSK